MLKTKLQQLSGIILWSFWMILVPPILDMIKTGGSVFWSFYVLEGLAGLRRQFITVFGYLPSGIVYYGTKITFILAIFLVGGLVLLKTKNYLKAGISILATYIILFILGSLPSWLVITYYFFQGSKKITQVTTVDIAQFFGFPYPIFGISNENIRYSFTNNLNSAYFLLFLFFLGWVFFQAQKKKTWAILKNARLPQLMYHAGLLFAGMGLGIFVYPQNFQINVFSVIATGVILISVWLAWLASVIVNDIYDFKIDTISNPNRPLQQNIFNQAEYADLGIIFFGLSILGGVVIGIEFAALLFVYQLLAWLYSAPPFRLKRLPFLATFFSALASLAIFILGFSLFSGADNIHLLSWRIILLLLITLTISLPVKDLKDVAGDAKDQVWTVPVLWGEEMGRLIIATSVFISFMLSVFFLNEFRLFWWALLFGSLAFLTLITKKIKPQQVFWWVLGIVFLYAVILAQIVFVR
jgi:chlorophyll synthase